MADITERRRDKRFIIVEEISEPVEIHFPPPFYQEPVAGKITNISASGIGLSVNEPLPKFFAFSLYIRLRGIEPFEVKGKVIRLENDFGQYNAGISFTEIDEPTVEMLNLIADDYDKCFEKRASGDKNFCFDGCMFVTLCNKKDKSVQAPVVTEETSKIDVHDVVQEKVKESEKIPEVPEPTLSPPHPPEIVKEEPEVAHHVELGSFAFSQVVVPEQIPQQPEKRTRKKLHPVYYVFLIFVFTVIVGFFSKDKITEIMVAQAEKKLSVTKYKSAIKNYKIVLKYEPKNIDVRLKLAETYSKMKMYVDAEKEFKEVLKIRPDMFRAAFGLGCLNINLNKINEAIPYFKKAKDISLQTKDAKVYLGICYEKNKDYDKAISEFSGISASSELPNEAYLSIGKVYGVKGSYKNAILFLSKANLSHNAVEYFEMGVVKNETEPDESLFNFLKAIAKKPDFPEAYEWLGLIYRKNSIYTSAIECYQEALNIEPQTARVYFNLAQLYALKDNAANAIINLKKAVYLDKTYIELAEVSYEFNELKNNYEFKKVLGRF